LVIYKVEGITIEPSAGLLSSISLSFSSRVRYMPFGTMVEEKEILEICALKKFFSLLKKNGLVMIFFSRSPEK